MFFGMHSEGRILAKPSGKMRKWIIDLDITSIFAILMKSSTDSIVNLESPRLKSRSFFFSKNAIIHAVEFKGPPHGEDSVLDTRIEGFDTPWLHTRSRPSTRRFLVRGTGVRSRLLHGGYLIKTLLTLDKNLGPDPINT